MGNCLGRCLPLSTCPCSNSMDFSHLIDKNTFSHCNPRNILNKLFSKRNPSRSLKQPVLELVDEMLNPPISLYSRLNASFNGSQQMPSTSSGMVNDIPLQCLDARALLDHTTSTPPSSLDLEWENDMFSISAVKEALDSRWTLPEEDTTRSDTAPMGHSESWSRLSAGNSLEWDCVSLNQSPFASEVDVDTQILLNEIERLTSQTLEETGQDLHS